MALPTKGYVFKVPKSDLPIFNGEKMLKLNRINSNDKTNDLIIKALTPTGKKVTGALSYEKFMNIILKNPNKVSNQFEAAETANLKRRMIYTPGTDRFVVMGQGATKENIQKRRA